MKRLLLASLLLTLCSACAPQRVAVPIRPDKENRARLICEAQGERPTLPAEYVVDWSKVQTVAQARAEHETYVRSVRTREGVIVGYVVTVEGKLFVCSNNAQWWRDFWGRLPG